MMVDFTDRTGDIGIRLRQSYFYPDKDQTKLQVNRSKVIASSLHSDFNLYLTQGIDVEKLIP